MEMNIKEAIEQLDWYFTADDGSAAEEETKLAYATVKQKIEKDALAQLREQEAMKPKKGVWLHPTSLDCCCSVCGSQPEHEPGEAVPLYPYCPDCGAKMEVKWDA